MGGPCPLTKVGCWVGFVKSWRGWGATVVGDAGKFALNWAAPLVRTLFGRPATMITVIGGTNAIHATKEKRK